MSLGFFFFGLFWPIVWIYMILLKKRYFYIVLRAFIMSETKPSTQTSMFGSVVPHSIEQEITQSYIDYAMSVIVSRALPDTRDGFKPVLRRILFAMYQMNNFYNQKHKKSARIV